MRLIVKQDVPGDPDRIRALADRFERTSDDAREASSESRGAVDAALGSPWRGRSRALFRHRYGRIPKRLMHQGRAYGVVAEALRHYAAWLDSTQRRVVRPALDDLEEAERRTDDLEARRKRVESDLATLRRREGLLLRQRAIASADPVLAAELARDLAACRQQMVDVQREIRQVDGELQRAAADGHRARQRLDQAQTDLKAETSRCCNRINSVDPDVDAPGGYEQGATLILWPTFPGPFPLPGVFRPPDVLLPIWGILVPWPRPIIGLRPIEVWRPLEGRPVPTLRGVAGNVVGAIGEAAGRWHTAGGPAFAPMAALAPALAPVAGIAIGTGLRPDAPIASAIVPKGASVERAIVVGGDAAARTFDQGFHATSTALSTRCWGSIASVRAASAVGGALSGAR